MSAAPSTGVDLSHSGKLAGLLNVPIDIVGLRKVARMGKLLPELACPGHVEADYGLPGERK